MSDPLLSPRDLALVDAIAERVLELLDERAAPRSRLVTAGELAPLLGRTREWVYEHADELGARRIGKGERPRPLFDVEEALSACQSGKTSQPPEAPAPAGNPRHRRRRVAGSGAELLPIGGRKGQARG